MMPDPPEGVNPYFWRIDYCVNSGLTVLGTGFPEGDKTDPDLLKQVADYAAAKGIELRLGGGGSFGSANPAERVAAVERMTTSLLHINKYAGIKFSSVANVPMPHNRWAPDPPMAERIGIIGENLAKLADNVRSAGITLGLENHCDYRGYEIAAMLEAANRPNMMAQIDTGNAFTVFEEPVDCAKAMAKWVVSAHLKDIKVTPLLGKPWSGSKAENAPMGQGMVDNYTICQILTKESPDPKSLTLLLEPLSGPEDKETFLQTSIAWCKAKLAEFIN
jgi:sugar phosphate isomerase/epimerase